MPCVPSSPSSAPARPLNAIAAFCIFATRPAGFRSPGPVLVFEFQPASAPACAAAVEGQPRASRRRGRPGKQQEAGRAGAPVSSARSVGGVASEVTLDLDPVSLVVVPHLDRIYVEMGRLCVGLGRQSHGAMPTGLPPAAATRTSRVRTEGSPKSTARSWARVLR